MWFTEYVPVCRLKTVLQSLLSLLSPPPHSPCVDRQPLDKRNILRRQQDKVVIRIAKGEGSGTATRMSLSSVKGWVFCCLASRESSTWLTAYVAKVFAMADNLMPLQKEHICEAIKFLILNDSNLMACLEKLEELAMER
ncbi:hypothetical protein PFLUV_G00092380 [Perca fluviatilis]|uniref:Alpha-macroglobulin-like TED domain-containing protein n=1 Tax=Perca fluviatilis TaxID=8168 RepID=A0A6A5F993_PERFL|nr:hypothetical protein PFLUV_G00092380 [Perca fluviatilis]